MAAIALSEIIYRACAKVDVPRTSTWLDPDSGALTMVIAEANLALHELRDAILEVNSNFLMYKPATPLTITSGVASLPTDCIRVKWLFLIDGTSRRPLTLYRMDNLSNIPTNQTDLPRWYQLAGNSIMLIPPPSSDSSYTVEIWYDQDFTAFTTTSSTVPALIYPGWEEFIVLHLAGYIASKEERDPGEFDTKKAAKRLEIQSAVMNRDEFGQTSIRITRGPFFDNTSRNPPDWGTPY